ncbi:hypothetical protein PRIPAC_78777 [Pristionchus pacificus]|uniref:Uncharacterized protein n=1 Tax=Pristionchus pacificus TaxID=54126 RepID=A0A2A6CBZ2_PRIPA|nr:hypothetical protein PRIPAC_78777 [Pristionchus pacificus]|eukprot:PDM75659.1 hypothetical protein PRIPAC_42836 [Pristionchus pacificus]
MSDSLSNSMKNLDISKSTSGYESVGGGGAAGKRSNEEGSTTSLATSGGGPPQRKADLAYNHLVLAERPGPCKASRSKLNVTVNYFKLSVPTNMKYATFRLEFEVENRGKAAEVKKEKMAECFRALYRDNRKIFPRKDTGITYNFQSNKGATFKGRPAKANFGRCKITPLGLNSLATVQVDDEANRCALMQFLDCILTQEHRFDLTGQAARFIQHGHSLFKIPRTAEEKRLDVIPIGRGEEVWLGLHAAVKCDSEELMINADTSGSIFKARNISLLEFFAQVVSGYTQSLARVDFENLTIEPRHLENLDRILKGTKLLLKHPNGTEKVKKYEGFTNRPANQEMFEFDGQRMSVADFFLGKYNFRLKCPRFPCLKFWSKTTRSFSFLPFELFFTLDEPTRFKGKLSDQQLDVFVKAVCQNPRQKKSRIQRFCTRGGEYLGDTAVMRMVEIEECPVLPLPHIEMMASAPQVAPNVETGEWKLTETDPSSGREKPILPVELNPDVILLVVVFVGHAAGAGDKERCHLLRNTLRNYGMRVDEDLTSMGSPSLTRKTGRSYETNENWMDGFFRNLDDKVRTKTQETGTKFIPLILWVFPRRDASTYAAIKYYCDVKHGIASQCTVRKTYEKLTGNPDTNASSQNLLLKILAKTGSIHFRLSSFAHKNVEKLQNEKDPVLIIGIDVSHPGREERFDAIKEHEQKTGRNTEQANKSRGQHEKLPTARPVGKTLFGELSYYDCPRSVVSVVGSTDIKGARYGVSSRVQRLGQEETVNMVDMFRERIKEFYDCTEKKPAHIIVYRDGASDTQVKKIAYEELESLERAMESFGLDDTAEQKTTITYIMAAKRHHTRFFRSNLERMPDDAQHLNCPPGTLVEAKVVSRNKWDFYLQSHYGTLGTALPTRYTVVRDDWKVSSAFIQTIVFAHCFGNVRCPKPLSIPIPLHYAHLAAKRSKVLFDHFKDNACDLYRDSREDLVREALESEAVTPHANIKAMKGMHYA